MELFPGVHSIPVGQGPFMGFYAPNVYLVAGQKAALIDSGYGDEASIQARLDYIRNLAIPLAYILITHAHQDHTGGAGAIQKATRAKILLHRVEAQRSSLGDRQLEGGEVLDLGRKSLEIVHTPGHVFGHICPFLREGGVLFSGDHILGIGTTVISPTQGDMGLYMESLAKLLDLPVQVICPGHGPPIRQAQAKVQELLHHRREREEQVRSCLARGKGTVEAMLKEIYPELDPRLQTMARDQILAHLKKLEKEGRVVGRDDKYYLN